MNDISDILKMVLAQLIVEMIDTVIKILTDKDQM